MDFPKGRAEPVEMISMIRIKHQPATDPDGIAGIEPRRQSRPFPVRMSIQETWCEFDHDRCFFQISGMFDECHMCIRICWGGEMAICPFALSTALWLERHQVPGGT